MFNSLINAALITLSLLYEQDSYGLSGSCC